MAAILGIGNATLDIVHTLDRYPEENDEIRCSDRAIRRGGNAANTLIVLGRLGHTCSWAGVLVNNAEGRFIRDDLEAGGVDTRACRIIESGSVPISSVFLNTGTGSRTIVHYRDLPEYACADFQPLDLGRFDWLHFEGRNVDELRAMLHWSREHYPTIPRSLEVEKPRSGIETLFGLADVLLFSRVYARAQRYADPAAMLHDIHGQHPQADLYCTWGEDGAAAMDRHGRLFHQPALAPHGVIDTLGAGDTFNAAVINGYLAHLEMAERLRQACLLAGEKCGQTGFDGLTRDSLQAS